MKLTKPPDTIKRIRVWVAPGREQTIEDVAKVLEAQGKQILEIDHKKGRILIMDSHG